MTQEDPRGRRALRDPAHLDGGHRSAALPQPCPKTVDNFVGLAEGTKEWTDPRTGKKSSDPLYDGTVFHRVIAGFMIQGGDPLGTGTGGPGYRFDDEIHPELAFTKPYLLAMANAGPGTNGSQFFITVAPTGWLTGKHTIFGEVADQGRGRRRRHRDHQDRLDGPPGHPDHGRVGHHRPSRRLIGSGRTPP